MNKTKDNSKLLLRTKSENIYEISIYIFFFY